MGFIYYGSSNRYKSNNPSHKINMKKDLSYEMQELLRNLDSGIKKLIIFLNKKNYYTHSSCSGHPAIKRFAEGLQYFK